MRTEPPASLRQLLAVMQLSDGGLPIGRFAHSGGLESWFQGRRSVGEEELAGWVEASLRFGAARTDGVATAEAHRAAAGGDIAALIAFDVALGTYKLSEAARRASTACGRQLAALAPQLFDDALMAEFCAAVRTDRSPGHLAVVAGAVTAAAGLNVEQAVLMEARGVVGMHLSAAVRLGRLTATRAQVVQRRLEPAVIAATEDALGRDLDSMSASAFDVEIAMMTTGRLDGRMFST
ncbi:urease accessory protein UreF [Methylobacterium sp.]|uniref:urease accessory protein UreF n=1 Tax=Methylobacterium sp. TaxID=409 RepID=UPI003B02AEB4